MKFLKVTNRGTVHRKFLELVGLGTKRELLDDLSVIGSKGSGSKLIVPACLRLNLELIICSSDEDGRYFLRYETRDVEVGGGKIVKQIFMVYGDETEIPTQFIMESFADWDKPIGSDRIKEFKIVREILANARDADPEFRVEIVDEEDEGYTLPGEGETSVFVTLTSGIKEMVFTHPERYFKFLGGKETIFSIPGIGDVYKRSSPETRVFLQGVLVECFGTERTSIFEYSVMDKEVLSEDRIIKDIFYFRQKLAKLLLSVDSPWFAAMLIAAIEKGKASFEAHIFNYATESVISKDSKRIYQAAWCSLFGKDTLLVSGNKLVDEDANVRGYKVQAISSGFLQVLLIRLGIKQTTDFVTREQPVYRLFEPTAEQKKLFDRAYAILLCFFPHAKEYPVKFFETDDRRALWNGVAGLGDAMFKEIWISKHAFRQGLQGLLQTLVHELRHCTSKAQDYCAAFEHEADKETARIMLEFCPTDEEK